MRVIIPQTHLKNLLLLTGGAGSERDVSLRSADHIQKYLNDKFNVIRVIVEGNKTWRYEDECCNLIKRDNNTTSLYLQETKKTIKIDLAMPILLGLDGEDGSVHGLFRCMNLKAIGTSVESILSWNKIVAKKILKYHGINMLNFVKYEKNLQYNDVVNQIYEENYSNISKSAKPIIVKPAMNGSSYGISVVKNEAEFFSAIKEAEKFSNEIIIEAYVQNKTEILCSVVRGKSFAIEVEYNAEFFNYETKYTPNMKKFKQPNEKVRERIESLSLKIFDLLYCKDYSRLDFIVDKDNGEIYFSELNTIPGMSLNSSFIKAMEFKGVTVQNFVDMLFEEEFCGGGI